MHSALESLAADPPRPPHLTYTSAVPQRSRVLWCVGDAHVCVPFLMPRPERQSLAALVIIHSYDMRKGGAALTRLLS